MVVSELTPSPSPQESEPTDRSVELIISDETGNILEEAYENGRYFGAVLPETNPYFPRIPAILRSNREKAPRGMTFWGLEVQGNIKARLTRSPVYQSSRYSNVVEVLHQEDGRREYQTATPEEIAAIQSVIDNLVSSDS